MVDEGVGSDGGWRKKDTGRRQIMEIASTKETSATTKPLDITSSSTTTQDQDSKATDSKAGVGFEDFMKSALAGTGKTQVSEEELFASLVEQRIGEVSPEAATFYATEKAKLMGTMLTPGGHVPMEDVALAALNATVASGAITEADGMRINGEAFAGAQLDSDLENLFDDKGGEGDPTIAVASIEEAMGKLKLFMDSMKAGTLTAVDRALSVGSTGQQIKAAASAASGAAAGEVGSSDTGASSSVTGSQSMDGGGGFVWKPVSESDGKLAVVLPKALSGAVDRVEIHSSLPPSDATKLAEGNFKGDANGGRPHFRFSKPGADFGDNVHVVAFKNDGTTVTWDIGDGGKRYD